MKKVKALLKNDLAGIFIVTVILYFILAFTSRGFTSAYNMLSVMQSAAIYVLIGLAQMATLSLGQMNLAVGSMGCLSAMLCGWLMQIVKVPTFIAIIICLLIGMGLGAIQGILISKTGINAFIVTLTLLSIYQGIAYIFTKGASYQDLPESFKKINAIKIAQIIPVTFIIAVIACILVFLVFRYSKFGQELLACGESEKAAAYSGIACDFTIIKGHAFSGMLAAVGAIIQMMRFGSAQIGIGSDWMLLSFIVAVLGGTLLAGGKVSAIGVVIGSFFYIFINNALTLWGVNSYSIKIFIGIILLASYEIDRMKEKISDRTNLKAIRRAKE